MIYARSPLNKRLSAKERVKIAVKLLKKCTSEELRTLHKGIKDFNTNKRVYIAIIRDLKSLDILTKLDLVTLINFDKVKLPIIITGLDSDMCLRVHGSKNIVLDPSHYLALSWPFKALPLTIGKYSESTNNIIKWRLEIGR